MKNEDTHFMLSELATPAYLHRPFANYRFQGIGMVRMSANAH